MKIKITLSQALDGYLLDAHARGLSPHTIEDYSRTFRRFRGHIGDPILTSITADDIRHFMAELKGTPVTPAGIAPRPTQTLSNKTMRNVHGALSSLWTWAISEGLAETHVVRAVSRPKPEQQAIEPYSQDDVTAMLDACARSIPYTRPGQRECTNARTTAQRDKAIILLLLDTGARVSEITGDPALGRPPLQVQDVDQRNLRIKVTGKGAKERLIPISAPTSKAIWRYLLTRPDAEPTDALILSSTGYELSRTGLLRIIQRLGRRADIPNAYVHRFRHTFAINFLKNGGNALELKRLLGHTSLDMVERYVAIARVDLERAHKKASPVTNWRLKG
jgi:site-specific recombinase XerD